MDHWLRILIGLAPLMAMACAGGPTMEAARGGLGRAAIVLLQADQQFKPAYVAARAEARDTSPDWQERDAKLTYWEAAKIALVALKAQLLAAESVLDAQAAGLKSDWLMVVGCTADAISTLRAAWKEIGQRAPPALSGAEAALRAAGAACGGP